MKLYSEGQNYKLYNGNMLDMLDAIEPNSIDSIVTDPPYELNFMNKGWDNSGIAFQKETWEKCLKVLKPGGYLIAFGGSRTHHRIMCAIEDAGFEIRDMICWIFGSGFPKSMNIGLAIDKKNGVESLDTGIASPNARPNSTKDNTLMRHGMVGKDFNIKKAQNEWDGWGTQLKPAYESITVARKPCEGSITDNVLKYGVGGINVDECRVPISQTDVDTINAKASKNPTDNYHSNESKKYSDYAVNYSSPANEQGRFPANIILSYDEDTQEEVCGGMPYTKSNGGVMTMPDFSDAGQKNSQNKIGFNDGDTAERKQSNYVAPIDSGSASRYFYCAKASKKDRDEGLDGFEIKSHEEINNRKEGSAGATRQYGGGTNPFLSVSCPRKNTHPTVKPTALMQYLVRLVTPKGGIVLDPFNGSGSTGKAVMYENKERDANYKYIGIELTEEYLPIADARINYVNNLKVQGSLL